MAQEEPAMRAKTEADIEESRSLGLALLLLRRSRGLTINQLSAASGSSRSNISCYESGKQMPRLDKLARLMGAMELPIDAVYRGQRLVDQATGRGAPREDFASS